MRKSYNSHSSRNWHLAYREAVKLVRFEAFKQDAEFEANRRKIAAAKDPLPAPAKLQEISDKEAHLMVCRWFIGLEKLSQEWWEQDGIHLSPEQIRDVIETLGIDCPKDSPAYRKLRPLFRLARVENSRRSVDRIICKNRCLDYVTSLD